MLDKGTVISTVEKYASLVTQELSPDAIILYGSYAKGTAHEDSDIDVAFAFNNLKTTTEKRGII